MIDWERVAELRDEIGAEDFGEIVDLFLSEVEGTIDQLGRPGDTPQTVADQMHFLKGAALNLGFSALSSLCRDGEKAAAEGNTALVLPQDVRKTFEESRATFETDFPIRFAA